MGGVNFFSANAQGQQWTLPNGLTLLSDHADQGSIQATIRPEQIQVLPEERSQDDLLQNMQNNRLPATAIASRFTGTQRRLTLAIEPDLFLQAWVTPTKNFQIGQSVWAHLPPTALWYFPETTPSPQAVEAS